MSTLSLLLASGLSIIPMVISYHEHLQLEKEIIISIGRAIIQLIAVGYVLDVIFGLEKPLYTVALILFMIFNAAWNTKKRGEGLTHVTLISFCALLCGTAVTLAILLLSGAIHFVPAELIPVSGMVISNSMVAIGLAYRNLLTTFRDKQQEVEVKLALGAPPKLAAHDILREVIKLSVMPSLDSAKTLGIVSLPGMMTGLILAGTPPLLAIKFQIMVTFMILSAASIATLLAGYLAYQQFFNQRHQLSLPKGGRP